MSVVRRIGGLVALLALLACSSPISLENLNKLKAGQTFNEVKAIIGEPTLLNSVNANN